jgi:hypothetical protein
MKVRFHSSGGIAGISRSATLDTDSLSPKDARQLSELVNKSEFFKKSSRGKKPRKGAADYMQYKITVESDKRSHTVESTDEDLSAELSDLIDFIQQKAHPNSK